MPAPDCLLGTQFGRVFLRVRERFVASAQSQRTGVGWLMTPIDRSVCRRPVAELLRR